jgi:hypothetical protein
MSLPQHFMSPIQIEDVISLNLQAGIYPEPIASHMRQAIIRIQQLSDLIRTNNALVTRAMDERTEVLSQTQQLHLQLMQCRKREFELRQKMHYIGAQALGAAQTEFVSDSSGHQNQTTSATSATASAGNGPILIHGIHFGDGAGPSGTIRYADLRRVAKKDKTGAEAQFVVCPNCEATFVDRKSGKECGLREHLIKFKCQKLKHMRPESETQKRAADADETKENEKKKKVKKTAASPNQTGNGNKTPAENIDNELDDLVVQVTTPPGQSSGPSPASSLSNIMTVMNRSQ